jgi:hypothetical protein
MVAHALHHEYLITLIADAEAQVYDIGSDSEYSDIEDLSSDPDESMMMEPPHDHHLVFCAEERAQASLSKAERMACDASSLSCRLPLASASVFSFHAVQRTPSSLSNRSPSMPKIQIQD